MKKFYLLSMFIALTTFGAKSQSLTVSGTEFLSVDSITFTFQDPGFVSTDWIGIYPLGIKPGDAASTAWQYLSGESGKAVFKDTLPGNIYIAYLLCCDGYEIKAASDTFTVYEPKLAAVSGSVIMGDTLFFNYESPMYSSTDWIGIYPDNGKLPGSDNSSLLWKYIPSAKGKINFTDKLAVGKYKAFLLCCDGYRILAETSFVITDPKVAFIRPTKNAFGPTDEISFVYNDPEYEKGDWIGVFYVGDDPAKTQSVAWKYVSEVKGTLVLDQTLPAGSFEAYLFCCDDSKPEYLLAKSEVFTSAGGAASSFIRALATVIPQNTPITFNYRSSNFVATDWIGIYNDNGNVPGSGNNSIDWMYVPVDSGTVTMNTKLAPGKYVAYLLCCDGYNIKAKFNFSIGDASAKIVMANSFAFATSDSLKFMYADPGFAATDWIGIYRPGEVPGGGPYSLKWDYVTKTSGTMTFENTLEVGEYWAGLFCCDGYDVYSKTTFYVVKGIPVSARDISAGNNKILIYPNPSNGMVTISAGSSDLIRKLEVFNLAGQLVYLKNFSNEGNILSVNLFSVGKGTFIVKASSDKYMYSTKITLK